jgi:hypothetical protein
MSSTLSHIGATILSTIASIGYVPFAILVVINIVLYRLHPVLGFLGSLFLFALVVGIIK